MVALAVPVTARQAQAQAPAPMIQNGRVETRNGAAIDREIAAVSGPASTEPVWVAWRVPMIPGDRDLCSSYFDRQGYMRGQVLDEGSIVISNGNVMPLTRPQLTAPTGPIPLEAGTGLVVLVRAIGGRVERLRTIGDDCPMDAGGRTVYWLSGVTSSESLRFLQTLSQPASTDRSMFDAERQTAQGVVRAIGLHQDAAADAALDQMAASHSDTDIRRQAASTLASQRGSHGFATVTRLLASATQPEERRSLVRSLGQSRERGVVDALRPLTHDADAQVRSDAVAAFISRGGVAVVPEALKIAGSDPDDSVRRRVVSSIGRLPSDAGIPYLLQLARAGDNPVARKAAVSSLSESKDPRAIALIEEILKK